MLWKQAGGVRNSDKAPWQWRTCGCLIFRVFLSLFLLESRTSTFLLQWQYPWQNVCFVNLESWLFCNLAYFAKDTISQGVIITVQKLKLKLHPTLFFFLGFYLFLQVEAPLHVEVVKLRHYLCTGWGKSCTFIIPSKWTLLSFKT